MPSGEPALLPDMDNTPPAQLSADSSPPVKHDIMAAKKAIQDPAGHFNFWRAEEMRDGNAEAKVQLAFAGTLTAGHALSGASHLLQPPVR